LPGIALQRRSVNFKAWSRDKRPVGNVAMHRAELVIADYFRQLYTAQIFKTEVFHYRRSGEIKGIGIAWYIAGHYGRVLCRVGIRAYRERGHLFREAYGAGFGVDNKPVLDRAVFPVLQECEIDQRVAGHINVGLHFVGVGQSVYLDAE
jgi:hypothetical protein